MVHTCIEFFGVLLNTGEITDEDLIVLLSERAAHEIYKKWLDTLHVSQPAISITAYYIMFITFPRLRGLVIECKVRST